MDVTAIASPAPEPAILTRFRTILGGIRELAAAKAGRDRRLSPMVLVLWNYFSRVILRFETLLARVQAGQPAAPRRNPDRRSPPAPPDPSGLEVPPPDPSFRRPPRRPRLPWGFGTLVPMGHEMMSRRAQLLCLLENPEMAALLVSEPRVGQLIRPLLRMLGLPPREWPQVLRHPPKTAAAPAAALAPDDDPPDPDDRPAWTTPPLASRPVDPPPLRSRRIAPV